MPTTYLEAIREGLWEEMERDPNVFLLGEDIGVYGGAFKVTAGFTSASASSAWWIRRSRKRPLWARPSAPRCWACGRWRKCSSPISLAARFDQIVNFAAKCRYRWGAAVPIVVRAPSGGGVHGGPFHSQNPEMWFVRTPGLKVVAPATAYDAKGLIKVRHPR